MKCNNCNTENEITSKFCFNCGSALKETVTEVSTQEETPVIIEEQPVQMEEQSVQEVPTSVVENVQPENKKGNIGRIVFFIVILVLFVLAVVGLFFTMTSPATVYKKALQSSTKLLSNTINSYNTSYAKLSITPKVELAEDNEAIDVINKFSFAFETKMDNINKAFNYNTIIKYNNNELFNISAVYKESFYLTLDNLLTKSIKVDIDEIDDFFTENEITEDVQYVYDVVIKAITSSLNKEYFEKTNETISINGKEEKVTANTLVMNSKNLEKLVNDVKTKLLKDKKFISSLAKITKKEESEIKEALEEQVELEGRLETTGKIVIYTTGLTNKVVKVSIITDKTTISVIPINDNKCEILLDSEDIKVLLNVEYAYEYDKEVNIKIPSNYINYEELDDTDIQEVYENLAKNKAYKELTEDIGVDLKDMESSFIGYNSYNY